MKYLLLLLLLPALSFSQDSGRIAQSSTLIIWYKVLPNNHYDIFVQNAHKDTSVIQYVLNDTSYSVRLGYAQKYQFIMYQPNGFTFSARNLTHDGQPRGWRECGSKRWAEKVIYNLTKPGILTTTCNGWYIIPNSIKQ